jgi:uncharacterized protein
MLKSARYISTNAFVSGVIMDLHLYPTCLNLSNMRDLTIEYGDGWGYPHVCRVLHLIEEIGVGLDYKQNVIQYAAYIHDWGAFSRFRETGVDHALRSVQVAEVILSNTNLAESDRQLVLDAIALHDYRDLRPAVATESLFLREADMLEMLGIIGILREFAWGSNNLKTCYERVLARRNTIAGRLTIPRAQSNAEKRLKRIDVILSELTLESFDTL